MSDVFLSAPPGLEPQLASEARSIGLPDVVAVPGGVTARGGWDSVLQANLRSRIAGRVLLRVASFRAMHPAQLDKRARRVDWRAVLRVDHPVTVEAVCRRSRIYHPKAAVSRIAGAIEAAGVPVAAGGLRILARIEDDLCTISVDTSGEPLHRRGFKQAVNRAPMRETMASGFLAACGHDRSKPVVDPMCGSGTFVIEAAERVAGLMPGRTRSFAFERLAPFEPDAWAEMRRPSAEPAPEAGVMFRGSDRDAGAVAMAAANAERAGVAGFCEFVRAAVSDAAAPDGPPGLVIANPPYGGRVGKGPLYGLYAAFGATMRHDFDGWRVALVTSQDGLARACDLPWEPPGPPVDHGGIKVRLWQARL